MSKFEIIDHTADVGLIAYGSTRKEVFINAAIGMFSLITDLEKVIDSRQQEIIAEADDHEELLATWLNELLYLFDAENFVFCQFEITRLNHDRLTAIAHGERIDLSRHELRTSVKAVTYHQLKIKKENGSFSTKIIFDV